MQSLHQTMAAGAGHEHQDQQQLQLQPPEQQPSVMIESLAPAEHGGTTLELMESQQQHLVQQQSILVQLEPSSLALEPPPPASSHQPDQEQQQQQQQQQQQLHQPRPTANLLKQRHHHQMDGGVAAALAAGGDHGPDGGGPIVQWLLDNYETADHESLPRSSVYNHYLSYCRQVQLATVNAASFGKLIRSVFMGLKTRRLGTRGHSKYHYFGIRLRRHIKRAMVEEQRRQQQRQLDSAGCSTSQQNENSNLQNEANTDGDADSETDSTATAEGGRLSASNSSAPSNKRLKREPGAAAAAAASDRYEQGQAESGAMAEATYGAYMSNGNGHSATGYQDELHQHQPAAPPQHHLMQMEGLVEELEEFSQHLGANWATLVDEHWPQREPGALEKQLANELAEYLEPFESRYKAYYKRMIELLARLRFLEVERLWQQFWHPQPDPGAASSEHQWVTSLGASNGTTAVQQGDASGAHEAPAMIRPAMSHEYAGGAHQLTYHQLYALTCQTPVIERINEIDYNLYEAMESFLFPDMLSPIPRALAQLIRQFGKNIGPWMEAAVKEYYQQFATEKSKSARAFGSAIRRYSQLNNLSTASRTIWEKRSSLNQMSLDLSRVDLRDIEHQVSWMSRHHQQQHHNSSHRLPTTTTTATTPPTPVTTTTAGNNLDQRQDNNNGDHQHHHLGAMQPAQLIQNFLHLLEDPYPANSWPDWCRNLVESRVCGLSFEEARNFVLKWNFYINLIINELTLRSARSFGSFQLIRMLFDEYIFHLVVNRLAQAQRKTPGQLLSM